MQPSLNIRTNFDRSFIIDTLKRNLASHTEEYFEAVKVYRDKLSTLIADLREECTVAAEKLDTASVDYNPVEDIQKSYNQVITLQKPIDARKMYENYINILSKSTDTTIELDMDDANSIINDSWDWAVRAKFVNSMYSSAR